MPWVADPPQPGEPHGYVCCDMHGGNQVGWVCRLSINRNANAVADTHLIAAAPELLAELQHFVFFHDQLKPEDIARAKALIAKATGEGA
jgi:hypothetical protein